MMATDGPKPSANIANDGPFFKSIHHLYNLYILRQSINGGEVLKAFAQNKESQTDGYAFCHVERKQPLMK